MGFRITTLIENLVYGEGLSAEHGLSLFIETGSSKILFDTGQSGKFADNASLLGIDLSCTDAVVLSHGHYDHSGGVQRFMDMGGEVPLYFKQEACMKKIDGKNRSIGLRFEPSEYRQRIRFVSDTCEPYSGVVLVSHIPIVHTDDTHFRNFFLLEGGVRKADTFEDELFVALVEKDSVSVVSGCSHRGISNILERTKELFGLPIDLVMGGFHLGGAEPEALEQMVALFERESVRRIGVCHCSGVDAFAYLKKRLGDRVFYNHTGKTSSA